MAPSTQTRELIVADDVSGSTVTTAVWVAGTRTPSATPDARPVPFPNGTLPSEEASDGMTAESARGRATGCLFFIGFGSAWTWTGILQTGLRLPAACYALGIVLSLSLLGLTTLLFRSSRSLPQGDPNSDRARRARRMFAAVNIIQWVSIVTAMSVFGLLHMPEYAVPAIAMIVGLHLFPLAGAFRYRQHTVTGVLLLAWSGGALALQPRERVGGIVALGTGLILLASAAWTIARGLTRNAHVRTNAHMKA